MNRRKVIAACVAALLLALLAWWLGPSDVAWSARAFWRARGAAPAWHHVAGDAPVVVTCDVSAVMASAVCTSVRPRLAALARTQGLDLGQLAAQVTHVVAVPEYVVGTGVTLSPGFLPRVSGRWREELVAAAGGGQARAVTDGDGVLVPLEPGTVLWRLRDAAVPVPEAAASEAHAPAGLELTDEVLVAGRVRPDERLRRRLIDELPRQGDMIVAALELAEIRLRPAAELGVEVAFTFSDEVTAAHLEGLLRQADATARLVRAAGPLAGLVGGAQVALLADVPPLVVTRDGLRVVASGTLDAPTLERWLTRAAQQLARGSARPPQ